MSTDAENPPNIEGTKPEVSQPAVAGGAGDAAPTESTSKANEIAAEAQPAPIVETSGANPVTDDAAKTAETTTAEPSGATVVAPDSASAESKKSKDTKKRRSSVPEHKSKKVATPKKKGPELQLDADAGDLFLATMKGYPKWPAIICDDEMLPETLLANRPVTARRPDGSYRDDFLEGGKNARDRTYPVMYLGTYEFSWMVNTCLAPLTPEQAANTKTDKMQKGLQIAFEEAKEEHDLQYYKERLVEFEQAAKEAAAEAEAKKKTPKKSKKKAADDEDEKMPDADAEAPKSSKSTSKKRKADANDEEEGGKKKMKLNLKGAKTPSAESAKKTPKTKTPKSDKKAAKEKEPQLSDKEKHERNKQATLYCRHRLQKAFLTSETPPKEEDMPTMAKYFEQLERADDIDAAILKETKIHKVMKGIVKLASIPKDEEYRFKQRSQTLLDGWSQLLGEPAEKPRPATANGEKKEETAAEPAAKSEEKKEAEEKKEEATEPVEQTSLGNDAQDEAMPDAGAEEVKTDKPADTEAPKVEEPKESLANGETAGVTA